MFRLICLAALAFASFEASAQFTLAGTVRGEKKEVLQDASVTLVEGRLQQRTDASGQFRFTALAPGSYTLQITFVGFSRYENVVNLTADTQLDISMTEIAVVTDEVIVSALRAKEKTPTTYYNLGKEAIAKQNFGQDLPFLLNWTPSLVTTSDAGAGVGYTGLRIRGSDATHINVTINGIPYNDSESQSVYWVDVPDIASSTQSIQIQRGVGTSTNGAGAFGGSVNLQTNSLQTEPYAEVSTSAGSFNTQKYTIKAGTGLINNVWAFDARVSKIKSDGYIERAHADLNSYYLSGGYYGKNTMFKAIIFGGHEQTYQSWYGIDPVTMAIDRRFNYAGAIYDTSGNVSRYYDRQIDDYAQDHYQLHFSHHFTSGWNANAALHYTYGRGYFEEYLQGQSYAGLGLSNIVLGNDTIVSGDFVTRQWLDNRFYGATYSVNRSTDRLDFTLGGAANTYANAKHWGEIIWAQYAGPTQLRDHYYDAVSEKSDFNIFGKLNYDLSEKLNMFLDMQYRYVGYQSSGLDETLTPYNIDDKFNFFNPKAGLSYLLSESDVLYSSYAIAHREPNRADYLGGIEKPRSEKLGNLETGWRRNTSSYKLEANYYLMDYVDQLVLTGKLNSGGYPIRANVGKSYRTGVEVSGTIRLTDQLAWGANVTWSKNKNKELVAVDNANNPVTYKNTDIILSPDWIAGSQLSWAPVKAAEITLLSKYVGLQYLDNTQSESVKMNSYFINDIRLSYTFKPTFVKAIELGLLLNNIFNVVYSSNGAVYSGVPYYYPQAGRNFLARAAIRF